MQVQSEVTASYSTTARPSLSLHSREYEAWRASFRPLDAETARRAAAMQDARRIATVLPERAAEWSRIAGPSPEPLADDELPRAVELRATFRVPSRPLAIWSPGPDGDNDGALVAYDPTNGTTSNGDIIVWPATR